MTSGLEMDGICCCTQLPCSSAVMGQYIYSGEWDRLARYSSSCRCWRRRMQMATGGRTISLHTRPALRDRLHSLLHPLHFGGTYGSSGWIEYSAQVSCIQHGLVSAPSDYTLSLKMSLLHLAIAYKFGIRPISGENCRRGLETRNSTPSHCCHNP